MEEGRCLESEREANLLLGTSLLKNMGEAEVDVTNFPGGIQDAWGVLSERTSQSTPVAPSHLDATKETVVLPLGQGQLGKASQMTALANCLGKATSIQNSMQERRISDGKTLQRCIRKAKIGPNEGGVWLKLFDEHLREIRAYHARHDRMAKRVRLGNPSADGYDLASQISESISTVTDGVVFQAEEVMGKYLDLQDIFNTSVAPIKSVFGEQRFAYPDFLGVLSKGLSTLSESKKLSERKKYSRLLMALEEYLKGFLGRTQPLLGLEDATRSSVKDFVEEWKKTGGCEGWEAKPAEASMASDGDDENSAVPGLDLGSYATAADLEKAIDGDSLKAELARLGLKCGGTVSDRAKRLFMTKDTPLDKLPKKMFAKKAAKASSSVGHSFKNERRVDIARREVVVTALVDQLKPTLEATIRRADRRETQTAREREKEIEEDLHGSKLVAPKKAKDGADDDSDDEDAPIYNPKGVPLGWDGKPIPYWLFKLHGLNHFYLCEICGNESYRGRRNFETHFAEAKHSFGMKSLGIPNTKHFHGVTKIEDAQKLWEKLKGQLQEDQFDGAKDEEYEDSHGNVLSRATYEDLARQGLL